jgi:hypothetical protein
MRKVDTTEGESRRIDELRHGVGTERESFRYQGDLLRMGDGSPYKALQVDMELARSINGYSQHTKLVSVTAARTAT